MKKDITYKGDWEARIVGIIMLLAGAYFTNLRSKQKHDWMHPIMDESTLLFFNIALIAFRIIAIVWVIKLVNYQKQNTLWLWILFAMVLPGIALISISYGSRMVNETEKSWADEQKEKSEKNENENENP